MDQISVATPQAEHVIGRNERDHCSVVRMMGPDPMRENVEIKTQAW